MGGSEPTWAEFVDAWELFRDPVLCAGISGVALGFLSVYIVLRRMVFVSAAVTQGAGLGVALAFYSAIHWGFDIDPGTMAVLVSLAVAGVLVPDPAKLGLSRETVLGLMFALTGGAAIVIASKITQEAHDIQAILFGTAVVVMPEDLRDVQIAAAITLVVHLWWFRGLTFASFDPIAARVQRLPVRVLDIVLLTTIGVMVGVSARALGALPVFALSTLPGAAAVLITRGHLLATFLVAAAFGGVAGVGGYLLSFFKDYPVGGAQTLTAAALLGVAIAVRALLHIGVGIRARRT